MERELGTALFVAAGVQPAGLLKLDNIDAAKKMVAQGLGVAFLPRSAVAEELAAGALASVAVSGAAPVRRQTVALRRRDAGPMPTLVVRFMELLASGAAV